MNVRFDDGATMVKDAYVVLEWVDSQPPYPRYYLATLGHAAELEATVRCVQTCASLESAAAIVAELNAPKGCYPVRASLDV